MSREAWLRIVAMIAQRVATYPDSNSYREACGYVRGYGLDSVGTMKTGNRTEES